MDEVPLRFTRQPPRNRAKQHVPLLLVALLLAAPVPTPAQGGGTTLSVPFLPQTEALCGGAATAMIFRFWGDRHAGVRQFEPLVDRAAEGISTTALENAIVARGWRAAPLPPRVEEIRANVAAGRPVLLLIEDRPSRFHYVVAVGADENAIVVHDPARGPSRPLRDAELLRVWAAAKHWALIVTPAGTFPPTALATTPTVKKPESTTPGPRSECDRLFEQGMDEIARQPAEAEAILGRVRRQCPAMAAPARELAGLRFSQKRFPEAEALASQAVRVDANDAYAWDLLATSRYVQDDRMGALDAWNANGQPIVDRVDIAGPRRARYNLLAEYVALSEGSLLTSHDLRLADRRMSQWPDRSLSRVSYTADEDGYAVVSVNVLEMEGRPNNAVEWGARGAVVAIDREVSAAIPGPSGQGEVWRGSWRFWEHRPRVGLDFAAPQRGPWSGVWNATVAWERQTYVLPGGKDVTDPRSIGRLQFSRWLTPSLRGSASAGVDAANALKHGVFSAALDSRALQDRVSIQATATHAAGLDGAAPFSTFQLAGFIASSTQPAKLVGIASASLNAASGDAPFAYWTGAGDGRARPGLLRGHTLLRDGRINGAIFGRTVGILNLEAQTWTTRMPLVPIGAAFFVDVANASHRLSNAGKPTQIDAGIGVRARLPGSAGTVRIDYGRGLRDGGYALTVGSTIP